MNRSKEVLVVCHCLLNSNAKVYPLAEVGGVYSAPLKPFIDKGIGLIQLPCPETCYLGMKRWGMTKEQYDHVAFRNFCRTLLEPTLLQISAFMEADYSIIGIVGMDGSPNCGIDKTCIGFQGGELCGDLISVAPCESLQTIPGMGIFMETMKDLLEKADFAIPFISLHNEPGI